MMGRGRKNQYEAPDRSDAGSIHGLQSLISGADGISLDGESLQLPTGSSTLAGAASPMSFPQDPPEHGLTSAQSLDGRSFQLPERAGPDLDYDGDEVSSINSSIYQGPAMGNYGDLKIVGAVENAEAGMANGPKLSPASGENDSPRSSKLPKLITATTTSLEKEDYPRGCCPLWLRRAPRWLKIVLVFSAVLLSTAIILVAVALTLVLSNEKSKSSNADANGGSISMPTLAPTPAVVSPGDGPVPVPAPVPNGDDVVDTTTLPPTNPPTTVAATQITNFYLTAGRYPEQLRQDLPGLLPLLPKNNGNSFLVHLGDWNSPFITNCDYSAYEAMATNFANSSIPPYFVVGDNEYNDCNDEAQAITNWRQTLVGYETKHWNSKWLVDRQEPNNPENFAFSMHNISFVGINLVAGNVYDEEEWAARHRANIDWIQLQYDLHEQDGTADVMVIFGHASPDNSQNQAFFTELLDLIEGFYTEMHFVYAHRNSPTQATGFQERYDGIGNLDVITVLGSVWPPVQATIERQDGETLISISESDWYDAIENPPADGAPQEGGQQPVATAPNNP